MLQLMQDELEHAVEILGQLRRPRAHDVVAFIL